MTDKPTTLDALLDRWDAGHVPGKHKLISADGCMCAQGQILHYIGGMTADELRGTKQSDADKRTAELLGISRAHAALLRYVNDYSDGDLASVIRQPRAVLGSEAQTVLAFWRRLDRMTRNDWRKVIKADREAAWGAAREAAWGAARYAAWEAAWKAAWGAARGAAREAVGGAAREAAWGAAREAVGGAAREAAGEAASAATHEIQGAVVMRAQGQPFFFLPLFGFDSPEAVLAATGQP
jgi:hypothetical protein